MNEAYTTIKLMALPPGSILILMLLAFFLVRGLLGRMLLLLAWAVLLIMCIPALSEPMLASRQAYTALDPDALAEIDADAIVILAAGVYANAGEYGESVVDAVTFERLRYGAFLHRRTGLPIYVTGGGGPESSGELMAKALRDELGIVATDVERYSRNTWENATMLAPLLRGAGARRVLLVTQAWHMPRSVVAFSQQGLDVIPAPTGFVKREAEDGGRPGRFSDWLPQANAFIQSYYALHELLGSVLYDLRARMAGPPTA